MQAIKIMKIYLLAPTKGNFFQFVSVAPKDMQIIL
jgi:hypothetical protein